MDRHNQIHIEQSREDFAADCQLVAIALDAGHPVHFCFAALASGHHITMTPWTAMIPIGQHASGVNPDYTFVALESWRNGCTWLLNGAFHHPGYLSEKLGGTADNPMDALAFAYLFNSIEQARGANLEVELEKIRAELIEQGAKIETDPKTESEPAT